MRVSPDWESVESFCRDYGVAVIHKNSAGLGVGDVVGYLGYLVDYFYYFYFYYVLIISIIV